MQFPGVGADIYTLMRINEAGYTVGILPGLVFSGNTAIPANRPASAVTSA